jgi:hypothetical protein
MYPSATILMTFAATRNSQEEKNNTAYEATAGKWGKVSKRKKKQEKRALRKHRVAHATAGKKPEKKPEKEQCTALMVIDEGPIRRKAVAKCKRMIKVCNDIERQIKHYETVDAPEYEAWCRKEFAKEISLLNELREKKHMYQVKFDQIQALRYWRDLTEHEAYLLLQDMEKNPEKYVDDNPFDGAEDDYYHEYSYDIDEEDEDSATFDIDEEDFIRTFQEKFQDLLQLDSVLDTIGGFWDPDELYDFIEDMIEMIEESTGSLNNESIHLLTDMIIARAKATGNIHFSEMDIEYPYDDWDYAPNAEDTDEAGKVKDTSPTRAKYLYYQLVKKLHPDFNSDLTEEHRRVWQRVQDAYRRSDTEELEILFAHYEIQINRDYSSSTTAEILAIHFEQKQTTKYLRQRLREYQKTPKWNFSNISKKGLVRLHNELRLDINQLTIQYRNEIHRYEDWLESIRQSSTARHGMKKRASRKKERVDTGQLELF